MIYNNSQEGKSYMPRKYDCLIMIRNTHTHTHTNTHTHAYIYIYIYNELKYK